MAVFLYNHFNRELGAYHVLAAFPVEQLQNNDLI